MDQDPRERTVDRIADQLRQRILRGEHLPRTLLPAERVLAEQLDVNRQTVRAALAQLSAEGLVQARQGQGVLVRDWQEHANLDVLAHLDQPDLESDVLELRRNVLADIVARAAARATFEDLADLDERDRAARQPGLDEGMFHANHEAFVRRLVQTSGSLPLALVFHAMERWVEQRPGLRTRLLADRDAVLANQAAMLNLVRAGAPDVALKAVRKALGRIELAALAKPVPEPAAEADAPVEHSVEHPAAPEPEPPQERPAADRPLDIDDFSHDPLPDESID